MLAAHLGAGDDLPQSVSDNARPIPRPLHPECIHDSGGFAGGCRSVQELLVGAIGVAMAPVIGVKGGQEVRELVGFRFGHPEDFFEGADGAG